jgi:trigger factor
MESSLKKLEQNKYELSVEVGREELTRYIDLAEGRIANSLQIDGFRKGKVPRDRMRKEVGDKAILEEALDIAIQDSLSKTIEKNSLDVLKVSDLSVKENTSAKLLYNVKVELFPEIKLADLSDLKIKRKDVAVDRKDIDEAIEYLRSSRSKNVPKEGLVEKGDRVEVDFEVTTGGLPVEGGVSKSHPIIIGDNKFIPGFEDQLLGMKEGEEKSFSLEAPKDYFHKSVAGKELDFKVKIVSIQEIKKPELNDEFAMELGQFANLKNLEENLSAGILEEKKQKEKSRLRLAILAEIASKSKMELPKEMVDERLNEMVLKFDQELHMKGMELSIYLAHLNKTEDELRKDWRTEAEKQVSFALILKKIAKDKNIVPAPGEVDIAADQMLQAMAVRGELDQENLDTAKIKEAIAADLVNEKVFKYLEDHCSA